MTTYLKVITSRVDGATDAHPHVNFALYTIPDGGRIHFRRRLEEESNQTCNFMAVTEYVDDMGNLKQETIPLDGNAYILSESGKTIAGHSS